MTAADKKRFRADAHSLKPVVTTGQSGLTDNVLLAIEDAINHHELIKIRLRAPKREHRKPLAEQICIRTGAELVQIIGQIAVIYRNNSGRKD